jgi:hypothetical protein
MKSRTLAVTVLLLSTAYCLFAADNSKPSDASAAFSRLKSLAGDWEGKSTSGSKSHVRYEVISGGSAVLEHFEDESFGPANAMVTVYYLDGAHLLLSHYCMAKNQPRMQAQAFDEATGELRFTFLDATGLASPDAGHMHNATFHFSDTNHFSTDWQFFENGKPKLTESLQYTRVH